MDAHVQHAECVEERDVNFDVQFGMQDEVDLLLKELIDGFVDLRDWNLFCNIACLVIRARDVPFLISNSSSVFTFFAEDNQHGWCRAQSWY